MPAGQELQHQIFHRKTHILLKVKKHLRIQPEQHSLRRLTLYSFLQDYRHLLKYLQR